ncbi:MAG: site-specific DNA-methyltransferase [Planctomycetia bacterium]|nr:site-specific DNA-methyltransferase [Planctomycetia bacterium]
MAKKKPAKRKIEQYAHADKKRVNNPPVGLVTPATDPPAAPKKTYQYDPHLDPQLVWAGKAERTSFQVPTVSLHVHERIDPKTIVAAVRSNGNGNGNGNAPVPEGPVPAVSRSEPPGPSPSKAGGELRSTPGTKKRTRQLTFFEAPAENLPLRDALDFYKHPHGWTNRLVAGDSLLVMNSLLEKEGLAGKVQMIYIDPPYGIRYGSNFQPFVNRRDVKDGKDEDLTQEPETLKAFRDTWELGIHSYLTYLRDRLLLARELLHESGSIFVQISDENLHHVRELLDDVFRPSSFISLVSYVTTSGFPSKTLSRAGDYILWYSRDEARVQYNQLYKPKRLGDESAVEYKWLMLPDGRTRSMTADEQQGTTPLPPGARCWRYGPLTSPGYTEEGSKPFDYQGKVYSPGKNNHWKVGQQGLRRLAASGLLVARTNSLAYHLFLDDYPIVPMNNNWNDTKWGFDASTKSYVVQTNVKVIERCLLMTTRPGDLVFDPTCGSGTTAYVAEQWGRRWITCDTSRVAITLAKQRLLTAVFDYYELAEPQQGVGGGFRYKKVPHVTLKSIANNPDIKAGLTRAEIDAAIRRHADEETLYDQPQVDRSKARVSGPFTVEAVPAVSVRPIDEIPQASAGDASVARSGETSRQDEWRDELAKTGLRGKGGQKIEFARLEPLPALRHLHAIGETLPLADPPRNGGGSERRPKIVVVSFGPEHAPLEQRQVEQAWEEARSLNPRPDILLFAAFHFDPEAGKDIDELTPQKTGLIFLRSQMNTDLLTEDLKKKRASNESFWLVGQPDVELRQIKKGDDKGLFEVEVRGFDYYNPTTGKIDSGDTSKIAMWLLDPDYDGRSLFPRQVFFPMAGEKEGWSRLSRALRAEIDEEKIEAYRGTVSLPIEPGPHKRVAVKIIDDRGIESLKLLSFS